MDNLAQELMPKLRTFLNEAGALALENQKSIERTFKVDNTLVTQTDIAISDMVYKTFGEYFDTPEHAMVDEETISQIGTPTEVLGSTTYTWTLDPIDGTVPYAYGRKTWAVSLGVLKNAQPWISAVYLPAVREMFLFDGEKAEYIKDIHTDAETTTLLEPLTPLMAGPEVPVDLGGESMTEKYEWDHSCGKPTLLLSSVCGHLSAIMGQSSGAVFRDCLWDFGGIWALAHHMGLKYRHATTGEVIDTLTADLFTDKWAKKDSWILSGEESFPVLQQGLQQSTKMSKVA